MQFGLIRKAAQELKESTPLDEAKMIADHPNCESERKNIAYWNFLPPNQLDSLLGLFQRVTGKYFNIAKILGIEGDPK